MLSRTARSLLRPSTTLRTIPHQRPSPRQLSRFLHPITSRRHFHASPQTHKGLQPDSSDPEPPKSHAGDGAVHVTEPANITAEEYHEIADEYIDELVSILEEKAEAAGSGYDTEYSAGVLTLNTPHGTYVLNKQPPNKQIWISSPISGPKRYDWVMLKGESQNQKQETGMDTEGDLRGGQWVYLRDGSTLTELLKREVDVQMNPSDDVGP